MGEVEQRIVTPTSHTVIWEAAVEDTDSGDISKQQAYPEEKNAPPACP
jgi:hypothetical protein